MRQGAIQARSDQFISSVLHQDVRCLLVTARPHDQFERNLLDWLQRESPSFVYVKTYVGAPAERMLADAGFVLVDEVVTLEKPWPPTRTRARVKIAKQYHLRWAQPGDEDDVVALAGRAFRRSRWHTDRFISHAQADEIKKAWAANYFRGVRGHAMAVVSTSSTVVGFLLLVVQGGYGVCDLIAVDVRHRRQGLASALLQWVEEHWSRDSLQTFRTGTQEDNAPAFALYAAAGFVETGRHHVWHWHAPAEVAVRI